LNLLGKQNVASLARAGIRAIAISSETASPANFQVSYLVLSLNGSYLMNLQAISAFHYQVIVVSPEQIMKPDWEFERLLKNPLFVSQIISIVIDEAHCLTDWGEFQPEYRELGWLRYILPSTLPLLVVSAMITKSTFNDITRLLHMQQDRTVVCRRSSDRPNVKIGVRKIKYALGSFADLMFLIPPGFKVGDSPPPKFLVFFDNIPDSIEAVTVLRWRLPPELRDRIKWFNADMSTTFKDKELENIMSGETWGLCTMTSFGMVRTMWILWRLSDPRSNREWTFPILCWSFNGERLVEWQRFGSALVMQFKTGDLWELLCYLLRRSFLMMKRPPRLQERRVEQRHVNGQQTRRTYLVPPARRRVQRYPPIYRR